MSEPLSRELFENRVKRRFQDLYPHQKNIQMILDHNAAQCARIAALEQENARLSSIEDKLGEAAFQLQDKLATLTAERDRLREALRGATVSLVAAIALLERGGIAAKRAAPSNKMFDQMLRDYKKSVKSAQAALRGKGG